ncbi:hypothetical protein ACFL6Q_06160 [Candidatus Neomarinimicrobiota bacterium]
MATLSRETVIRSHPWLLDRDLPMIISADEDGLLSAAFLHHSLGWKIAGYYDCSSLWLSQQARDQQEQLVWLDLDILSPGSRALGHHILTPGSSIPEALDQICNPNLLAGIGVDRFTSKYPFSMIIFVLWIHSVALRKDLMARLLVLHADSTWLNVQRYSKNCKEWEQQLPGYDWRWLFQKIDTELFETRMKERLLPQIQNLRGYVENHQLRSRHLSIPGGQIKFNPDWDIDIALGYLRIVGTHLKWSPPSLPDIIEGIEGKRNVIKLPKNTDDDLPEQLQKRGIFSYAFTHQDTLNFTELEWRKEANVSK